MSYEIEYHKEVEKDLKEFDRSIKIKLLKQVEKLSLSPQLGESLGNKFGLDLSGYKKMYCCKKQIRIVYKIGNEKVVVFIVAIGKREDEQVYKLASERKE